MPDEADYQSADEGAPEGASDRQRDGAEVRRTEDKGMDGQVSTHDAANIKPNAETAASPEEEPVGSNRTTPRPFKKMNATDFKVKPAPKPEPKPAEKPPLRAESRQEKAPGPVPQPAPEPAAVQPEPAWEPEPAPVWEEPAPQQTYEEPPEETPKKREPIQINIPIGGIGGALKAIFSFFTIIKINVDDKEIQAMNKNFFLIPIVGLVIGVVASLVAILFEALEVWEVIPIAVIATIYILSKFLHFDGLVDFGDGIIAGGDKEGCIKALKDTRIGAGGLGIALITVIAIFSALGGIWSILFIATAIVTAEVFVKNAMVAAAAFGEPGTGMASEQVRNTSVLTLAISTVFSAGLAFVGFLVVGLISSPFVTFSMLDTTVLITVALMIAGAVASSILVGWLIAYLANRKFGFVNGDVLGAANEISRVFILLLALIIVSNYAWPILWLPSIIG